MIDKKSIIKMTEHVFRKSQGYPDRRLMHPKREWGIGILFFVCVVILGSILAGNLFVTYNNVGEVEGESNESIPQYREVIVKDALEKYRKRTEQYKMLREKNIPVIITETATSTEEEISETVKEEGLENFEVE